MNQVQAFLDDVDGRLRLNRAARARIREELSAHVEDRVSLESSDGATPDAVRKALADLGTAAEIADDFNSRASLFERIEYAGLWRAIISVPAILGAIAMLWAFWQLAAVGWGWLRGDSLVWGGCVQPDNTACLTDGIQHVESIAWASVALMIGLCLFAVAGVIVVALRMRAQMDPIGGVKLQSPIVRQTG